MIGTIRKHSTVLWAIIITGTIISFVYFFSPDARYNIKGRSRNAVGSVNGRHVSNTEYNEVHQEARLRYFFRFGSFPDRTDAMAQQNWDAEQETNARLVMLEKMKELGVKVGLEATLQFRDELLDMVTGGKAPNPQTALTEFDKQILRPNGLTMADFERFVRNEVGIMHLIHLGGISGRLVPPKEAEQLYRREYEEVVAELVVFSASNHIASLTNLDQQALRQYYTNHLSEYRIPERLQVAFIRFDLTNFLAQAGEQLGKITNLNQQVDALYRQQGPDFYKDKDDKPLSEEAAKERIMKEIKDREALRLANKKAYDLVNLLSERPTLAELEAVAASNQLPVQVSAPFDREDGPADLKVPEKFVDMAFRLSETEPVSLTPIIGEDGAYVFALKKRIPSESPEFEAVRAKVEQGYREGQAQDMARTMGKIFYNTLTNGLALKKSFTEICLDGGHKPIILPPFARSTSVVSNLPPTVSSMDVKRLAFNLEPGNASAFTPTRDGGIILFLRNRFPVDENKMRAELPQFANQLRYMRQGEAANDWFVRQRRLMQEDLPKTAAEREREKAQKKTS